MKTFTIAAVMLALLMTAANAQARRPAGEEKNKTDQKIQVDEGAYKAALERIPEPKEKYDPWGVARPAESAKKSK
jgi:opacity protein-like surface antigen